MKSPGIEVRPLRQMTGESEFNEVFFRDVRVPVENVVGQVNKGWDVAMGTLMHERGTFGAGLQITYRRNMDRLVELSRTIRRGGKPASQDPVVRQKLAQCYAEVQIMRLNYNHASSPVIYTRVPGP
jgi:alkylation response protein AidB-like acyl-CoA dehydrogenase